MTAQQLRSVYKATPFRPFTLHMADGRSFHIPHPDFLSMSPSGRTAIVFQEDENFSILDLLLLTEIEVAPASASKA